MTERIRFHLDENVSSAIATALRRFEVDVTTTSDAGLIGTTDLEQYTYIQKEVRVMVTHDDDFLRIASIRNDHPGIVYCRKDARSIGEMIEQLTLIYEVLSPNEMKGQVQFL